MPTHTSAGRLHLAFLRAARRHWNRQAMADSTGQSLTYGRAALASVALGRALRRRTPGETNVGVLLPASVGGALANLALAMSGRTPVNLNFTIGADALDASIEQAGIRTIVSSRVFLEKAGLAFRPSMILLEDIRKEITAADKIAAAIGARLVPEAAAAALRGGRAHATETLATIVFSSGSTGLPKGVMLTHANVLENIDAFSAVYPIGPGHCMLGVLPFFHSF